MEWHDRKIKDLTELCATFEHQPYIREILTTVVKMGLEKTDNVDLKLVNTALKELRYSFLKLSAYRSIRKVTVFGSARSAPDSSEYLMAEEFSRKICDHDYMVITGAGPGVMEAGNKGAGRDRSFGVNIELPFEQSANPYIDNDHKLINFNYFFTRKLIFIKESCATVVFPGGFGTLDEAFENMTLFQTGKSSPRPIIFLEPEGMGFWKEGIEFIEKSLLKNNFISESDMDIFHVCTDVDEAIKIIRKFHSVYHSIRNVGAKTVLRLEHRLSDDLMVEIQEKFSSMFKGDTLEQCEALPQEIEKGEFVELPRLAFEFEHRDYGQLKGLIDLINRDSVI